MDDRDWLDQRLASGAYLSDDGFTGQVVGRIATGRSRALVLRRVVLTTATVAALILALVQSIALTRSLQQLHPAKSVSEIIAFAGAHAHSVAFQAGVAAALTLLALTLVFFSRRWI